MRTPYIARTSYELLSSGLPISTSILHKEMARQERCEECILPGCRRCPEDAKNEIMETSIRVAAKLRNEI